MLARYREPRCTKRTTRDAWCARTTRSIPARTSIVLLDFDIVMNRRNVLGITRNGCGLVCRFLGSGAAGQPHDAILVRVDVNAPQAGDVLGSQLGLDACRD